MGICYSYIRHYVYFIAIMFRLQIYTKETILYHLQFKPNHHN